MSRLHCLFPGCLRTFKKNGDLTKHVNSLDSHKNYFVIPPSPISSPPNFANDEDQSLPSLSLAPSRSPPPPPRKDQKHYHRYLTGEPCDKHGVTLPPDTPAPPKHHPENQWYPFEGEAQFRLADLLFKDVEMSQGNIDELLNIWSLYQRQVARTFPEPCSSCSDGPFGTHTDMYSTIDSIADGNAPWGCLQTFVDPTLPGNAPEWKKVSYQVWYCDPDTVIANILTNAEFAKDFDVAPYVHLDGAGKRRWADFMSGNFAWRHAVYISLDNCTKGAMLVPIILGADKTTVSVATGHVEYHPLYLSIGNITNAARRAHRNAVIPIGFLAIPKADRKYDNDNDFRVFKKQLYHTSIAAILQPLRPGMERPVVRQCPDGHFQRIIYDLAAFIADYPEQVYLSGIVQGWCGRCSALHSDLDGPSDRQTCKLDQILCAEYRGEGRTLWDNFGMDEHITPFTSHFPRADIHEMLSPDLLHQIIKGCFKDMLVEWTLEYLAAEHGEVKANQIIDDIDRRLAAVPAFPGLRHFPHGRRFKQWTGDDSKALMKIFLPAVAGYLPDDMMKCLTAFLDFCYLVRCSDIDEISLTAIESTIQMFHHYRNVYETSGVCKHFSVPRMHSMIHYPHLVKEFGSPNGLCSSITESRHITAVKKPWRRSNRYQALGQILLTNQRLDKLAALRSTLMDQLLITRSNPLPTDPFVTGKEEVGPVDSGKALANVKLAKTQESGYPRDIAMLGAHIKQPDLEILACHFLCDQLGLPANTPEPNLPYITSKINVYHSAIAIFFAPSDHSGARGMKQERIRSTPSWHGAERRDCVLAVIDDNKQGFAGMSAAHVLLFFSFQHEGQVYPCALVHLFNTYGQQRDPLTGLWIVQPAFHNQDHQQRSPCLAVIHLDSLLRGVHLIPVYGSQAIPSELKHHQSLDVFKLFYVNKYADYHANEILF
ncbi:hypothetical protein F5050DRAFT_1566185 [Lentinula boryana]|uniref:C2H2-type domain-containing protein n=1 Tax=Lentinula boryana TaxID=40481 RepID=A0ABQ8QKB7_9AGAR|nr:hypothetical protein F5050DRAFT_1566185 [Lentinula boryana]